MPPKVGGAAVGETAVGTATPAANGVVYRRVPTVGAEPTGVTVGAVTIPGSFYGTGEVVVNDIGGTGRDGDFPSSYGFFSLCFYLGIAIGHTGVGV